MLKSVSMFISVTRVVHCHSLANILSNTYGPPLWGGDLHKIRCIVYAVLFSYSTQTGQRTGQHVETGKERKRYTSVRFYCFAHAACAQKINTNVMIEAERIPNC